MDYCNLSFNSYEHAWLYRANVTSVVTAYVPPSGPAVFTKDPQQLRGEFITTQLEKSPRGFGFTILGTYVRTVRRSLARSPPYEYEQCRGFSCLLFTAYSIVITRLWQVIVDALYYKRASTDKLHITL